MKKLLLITGCFSLFIFSFSICQGQQWCWGREGRARIKSNTNASPVATNRFGNAYITGSFENVIIFDQDTLFDNFDDTYIVKYDSHGNVLWAKNPTSSSISYGYAVISDANDNAYITGSVSGSPNHPIIFGTDSLFGNGFFVKYSPTGQVLWAMSHSGVSLAMDKNGNICLATEDSLMKFNPNEHRFMAAKTKYNNSAVATDNLENIYITGIQDTISIHIGTEIPYIAKYDSNGNLLWERQPTFASFACMGIGNSVITDKACNVYLTGYFSDTLSFGPYTLISPYKLSSGVNADYALFLAKYDKNGNLLWARQTTGIQSYRGTSLAKDNADNIYLGGSGINTDTLLFGGRMLTLPTPPISDLSFILKLDTAGTFVSGSLLRNGTFTYPPAQFENEIAVDSNGNYCFLTGSFLTDTIFCANDTLYSTGAMDSYIAKWNQNECIYTTDDIPQVTPLNSSVLLYPNPNNGAFTLQVNNEELRGKSEIEIYNVLGEKVYSQFTTHNSPLTIDLKQPSGIYLYRVVSEDGSLIGQGKVIVQK